jgi:metal iron transporter
MSGFLGMTTRPWIRRIVTRSIAIIPAMVAACVAGREGLSSMLVGSQVALSIQLPFAVVPLIYFTSKKHVLKLELVVEAKNMEAEPVRIVEQNKMSLIDRTITRFRFSNSKSDWFRFPQFNKMNIDTIKSYCIKSDEKPDATAAAASVAQERAATSTVAAATETMATWPDPLTYANGKIVFVIACLISLLLIGLNGYLVVSLFLEI